MNSADIKAAAARLLSQGRGNLGRYKVFVAPLARELGVDLESFKATLLALHRAGDLKLSRCDLQADYRQLVRESEIRWMIGDIEAGTFHLVNVG